MFRWPRQTPRTPACILVWALILAGLIPAATVEAQPARAIDPADYRARLAAMWQAECIANWTGLPAEGCRVEPPFFTDADWGVARCGSGRVIDFVLTEDPWGADDDTDIEYVYLYLHMLHGPGPLTPRQIADGWRAHINRYIWVSDARARELMERGVRPPVTGFGGVNQFSLQIDAQLTTEFFGALAPGMPEAALQLADLPIRAVSDGFATHAAQFFVVLYSLATQTPPGLTPAEANVWLVREARRFIPDTSKSADIADFVLADYLANPDPDDWERTRDKVHVRYQRDTALLGFRYRGFAESSVNFGTAIMSLLYGGGDLARTIQIATLSGWDADNPTASMAGLLGLMHGPAVIEQSFPGVPISGRFWAGRTRDALPDYLPADPAADDMFALMAERSAAVAQGVVVRAGGRVEPSSSAWLLPPAMPHGLAFSPTHQLDQRSANRRARREGWGVRAASSVAGQPPAPPGTFGSETVAYICDGYEHDFSGREPQAAGFFFSTQGGDPGPSGIVSLTVEYDRPVPAHTIRFIEGDHFGAPQAAGGWFEDIQPEVRVAGQWTAVPIGGPGGATLSEPLDPLAPFQIIDIVLAAPMVVDGVRLSGRAGGAGSGAAFVTCAELDVLSRPPPPCRVNCNADLTGTASVRLDILDFTCFQNAFALGDTDRADTGGPAGCTPDGTLSIIDFTCFQNLFALGCP